MRTLARVRSYVRSMARSPFEQSEYVATFVLAAVDQATRALEADIAQLEGQLHTAWLAARGEAVHVREGDPLWSPALLEVQRLRDRPHPHLTRT